MIKLFWITCFSFFYGCLCAQKGDPKLTEVWHPVPEKVQAYAIFSKPPAGAVILFEKKADTAKWKQLNGSHFQWNVSEDYFTVKPATGNIVTKQEYGDCQLHIEWRTPVEITDSGQGRGNSGIFFMGRYELQILDSYNNDTYVNGMAGSIYKQHPPLVNASLKPGEWQSYDVLFKAPVFFANGMIKTPARVTVFHNAVLILDNVSLQGSTQYIGIATYTAHADKAPLMLQDHKNKVSFRNIWLREL